ncbi:uncharacterized protein LOC114541876 [Dendronephthya gigantea]|uniref:uncharacterized protein LOC114541876 n=1 Tax=Dendronephthya gigantea TaxID=151771 RepID=UPI0010692C38|nr:uncharacterized protein LOC114541876 [Dendronephthya gigantea]
MFRRCFLFVTLFVVSPFLQDAACFFLRKLNGYNRLKPHCVNDTGVIHSEDNWGNSSFLELAQDSCLDPSAQFRFRDNGAMLNIERQGCLAGGTLSGSCYDLDLLYLDTAACAEKRGIHRAINQTPKGTLSILYKRGENSTFEALCATYKKNYQLKKDYGIHHYLGLISECDHRRQRFVFGTVTCYGDMVKNANCPKNQYMVVKIASFRGLLATKPCGFSLTDYSCELDVTCLVKKQCDGLHECRIRVNDTLFSADRCPGLKTYLYFEYQCVDTVKTYRAPCVHDLSLSYSSLRTEGVTQITTDSGVMNICRQSLRNDQARNIVCRQLGYSNARSILNVSIPMNPKDVVFSGSITCTGDEKYLSQCSIIDGTQSCSELSYIECYYRFYGTLHKVILVEKQKFPDSSFSATASMKGHTASDARISSGGSWCAPVSGGRHYLQVDLRTLYRIYYFVTYGDRTSPKWIITYKLNYTTDLVKWKMISRIFQGNKNAYGHSAWQHLVRLHVVTRALRFIPIMYAGQPCVRIDFIGYAVLPGTPRNLTLTDITSRSADVSWLESEHPAHTLRIRYLIKVITDNSVILNVTTDRNVYRYKIDHLTPYTVYEISISARNYYGFGVAASTSFLTSEEDANEDEINDVSKTYLIGMIIAITLLIASFVIIFCLVRQIRRLKSLNPNMQIVNMNIRRKNSSNIYDIPEEGNVCEEKNKENGEGNYTELQRRDHEGHFYMKYNATG